MVLLFAIMIIPTMQFAEGHKVIMDDENHSIDSATEISDHSLSRVVYDTLHEDEPHYFVFESKGGEVFFGEIVIPAFPTLTYFEPNFAIISSDDTIRKIQNQVTGSNAPCNLDHTMSDGCFYKVHTNFPYNLPIGLDALVFENIADLQSEKFFEPFSMTEYYQRQTVSFDLYDDKYYMVVFEKPNSPENSDGRFALAFGYVEDWSPIDFVTTFPYSVISANLFFENYGGASFWILLYVGLPLSIIYGIRQKRKR